MNKHNLFVTADAGHQLHIPPGGPSGVGPRREHAGDDLKSTHGTSVCGRERAFDLIGQKVAETAEYLTTTVRAHSYEVAAIGVGIGSVLGYLVTLRWVWERF